ncbi:MAG: RNA polymerase sigma factor [Candidatus Omnitrophota bacterium]
MSQTQKISIFSICYSKYFNRVVNYAMGILHNRAVAEDVVQEAFARCYNCMLKKEFMAVKDVLRWVYKVSRNLSYNHIRHLNYVKPLSLHQKVACGNDTVDLHEVLADSSQVSPHAGAVRNELAYRFKRAFSMLSHDYRSALELCCIDGYSYKTTAFILNRTQSAVAHNVMRAKRKLNKILCAKGGESGF